MNRIKSSMARIFAVLSFFLVAIPAATNAQDVTWKVSVKDSPTAEKTIVFSATVPSGWHLYDMRQTGGPNPLVFHFDKVKGATLSGNPVASKAYKKGYDEDFNTDIFYYEGAVTFTQKVIVNDPKKFFVEGYAKGQICSDAECKPTTVEFKFDASVIKSTAAAPVAPGSDATPSEEPTDELKSAIATEAGASDTAAVASTTTTAEVGAGSALWKPVIAELKQFGDKTLTQADASLWFLFISGFLYGFVALVTPCVWPMIPMTVSFFLKRTKSRKKAIKDAITYGLSIVVIYLLLGIVITLIFGASALNSLATNAVFNIIFFLLLVFFAVSFFGAFELVLPAKWTNKLDSKADNTTGLISIFFMAFTLALVSFSCTGPIIGTLLVQAATMGSLVGPAVGMFGFALALALPFTLFAIFPNMLQTMPKSGGWLNSVKVVLAFLELALALKFLSVADLAYGWRLLDRETFVSLWIVIFASLGFYLLGKIKFPHDSDLPHVSVTRYFLATISLAFAVYMLPGLWGAPLKSIAAFAPPLTTQDFNLYSGGVHAEFDDYDAAMEFARKQGKPVLVDFSGHGCVNCRKMENSVWIHPEVRDFLEHEYVLITLMVDEKKDLPQPITVTANGKEMKLRTVGDKWSYLQQMKFGGTSQPFYVLLDNEGMPLGPSRGYNEDVPQYVQFLKDGLKEYKARSKK